MERLRDRLIRARKKERKWKCEEVIQKRSTEKERDENVREENRKAENGGREGK